MCCFNEENVIFKYVIIFFLVPKRRGVDIFSGNTEIKPIFLELNIIMSYLIYGCFGVFLTDIVWAANYGDIFTRTIEDYNIKFKCMQ